MPSPADRRRLERALRAGALALLAWCAWALATSGRPAARAGAGGADLARRLPDWSRQAPADTVHLTLTAAPDAEARDWLAALARAGTAVTWSGAVPATAVEVVPSVDPAGGAAVLAAAPAGSWVRLADSLGVLDSSRVRLAGVTFALPAATGGLRATTGPQDVRAALPAAAAVRHVVVLGTAGWEARFVTAALEERGWTVDARFAVAPGITVAQGAPWPLDTARHAAVVALDSLSAAEAAALARFVSSGGGAVLAAAAVASAPGLGAGAVGPHRRAAAIAFTAAAPKRALALDPVLPRGDAVALERQDGQVVLAARRVGAGRVAQLGYDETWRWRMAPLEGAADQHRAWWAGAVAAVARGPEPAAYAPRGEDRAPLAALVAALGPAGAAPSAPRGRFDPRRLLIPAGLLALACLLGDWASRRLRGAA